MFRPTDIPEIRRGSRLICLQTALTLVFSPTGVQRHHAAATAAWLLQLLPANAARLMDVRQPSNVQRAPAGPNWATFLCIAMATPKVCCLSLQIISELRSEVLVPLKKPSSQLLTRSPGRLPGVAALIHAH